VACTRSQFWTWSLLVALAACAPAQPLEPAPNDAAAARRERIAQELDRLAPLREELRRSGVTQAFTQRLDEVLAESPGIFTEFPTWGAKRRTFETFLQWNRPLTDKSDTVAALDTWRKHHPYNAIRSYAEQLAERGIELLVVPAPNKFQVYPDDVPGFELPEPFVGADLGTYDFFAELGAAGVEVLNLAPTFIAQRFADDAHYLFNRYDSHWTARGVALAADVIAERVRAMPWFTPGPNEAGTDFHYEEVSGQWQVYQRHTSKADEPVDMVFPAVLGADGKPAHQRDRLSPILLIGDSFSYQYRAEGADLASQLFARLGYALDTISVSGGGKDAIWQALAQREGDLSEKRLVIWCFSGLVLYHAGMERYDLFPDDDASGAADEED